MLVIIGADEWGNKDVLGLIDGFRESTQSWREPFFDLKRRGLEVTRPSWPWVTAPWGSAPRCWVHKFANMLNAMPKSVQTKAKVHLKDIWIAETKAGPDAALDFFVEA